MAHEFKLRRTVEFAETDMAGIVHFSNFFRYMEATEHAFFRSLGLTLHQSEDGVMSGWARADAQCKYVYPLRYQDEFDVHLVVQAKTASTITYRFDFRLDGREVARGSLRVVCVTRSATDERMRARPMPAEVDERVEVAPRELLTTQD